MCVCVCMCACMSVGVCLLLLLICLSVDSSSLASDGAHQIFIQLLPLQASGGSV